MPRKKRAPLTLQEQLRKLKMAQLDGNEKIVTAKREVDDMKSLEERVRIILALNEKKQKRTTDMLFFVMYDIESNKVRRLVSKYLIENGCTRIQNSIFLAEAPTATYNKIKTDLAEVQEAYENEDSILVLPVSTDYLRMMKVIGKNIDIDIITHSRNTLFF